MSQDLRKWAAVSGLALAMCGMATAAHTYTFKVLHVFAGGANDGAAPQYGSLIKDKNGNLYGMTVYGGAQSSGVVFRLAPDGTLTVLHSFGSNGADGMNPSGGVIRDSAGNLYGTTTLGGTYFDGTVFKLTPGGTETILHSFAGSDGKWPYASLIMDDAGNLYGTASQGGNGYCLDDGSDGCGTAFEIAPDGTFTKLHDFSSDNGEEFPLGSLVRDQQGYLYGTTNGDPSYYGTVFMLAPDGTETLLYSGFGGNSGAWPWAGPIRDSAGNLYGTTQFRGANGDGAAFELAPDGTETTLHAFDGGDGVQPQGTLVRDKAGNLYGTTYQGGKGCDGYGCGVAFKIKADGALRVLHRFDCSNDGCQPRAGLLKDGHGNLYGTTFKGGAHNYGTVFELVK